MPTYIIQYNYTTKGITAIKDSPKRLDAGKKLLKKLGGEMKAFYLTTGSHDLLSIVEAPDDQAGIGYLFGHGGGRAGHRNVDVGSVRERRVPRRNDRCPLVRRRHPGWREDA